MKKTLSAMIAVLGLSFGCSGVNSPGHGFYPQYNHEYQTEHIQKEYKIVEKRRLVTDENGVMTSEIIGVKRTLIEEK